MADQTLAQDKPLSSPSDEACVESVCAVTVTYGNRRHLVLQVLQTLLRHAAIQKIVLVNNGAEWNVRLLAQELAGDRIEVIDFPANRGSAIAFAAGINRACELGTDYVWLLDDDNEPQDGALSELLEAHVRLSGQFPKSKLAVVPFRPDHQSAVTLTIPHRRLRRKPSSFWNFHVLDVPYKLWCHTPWGRLRLRETLPPQFDLAEAPYGGLLFHPSVVAAHGLPWADFVVYDDDIEFTYRITRNGGALRLITTARVVDLDTPWYFGRNFGNSFRFWLLGGSDKGIFYPARNRTYLDSHCFPRNRFPYWLNRKVYCSIMWIFALFLRRMDRYHVLQSAIRDGLAGRMGMSPRFPLE